MNRLGRARSQTLTLIMSRIAWAQEVLGELEAALWAHEGGANGNPDPYPDLAAAPASAWHLLQCACALRRLLLPPPPPPPVRPQPHELGLPICNQHYHGVYGQRHGPARRLARHCARRCTGTQFQQVSNVFPRCSDLLRYVVA